MPFQRPTIQQLIDRIGSDIQTRLPGTDPTLRRSFVGVLGRVLAGAVHSLFGFLDWTAKQLMPDTAEKEYLDRHASIWLTTTRKVASAAVGAVTFTGTDTTVVPAGTTLQRSDGVEFTTDAIATIASGSAIANVTAVVAGSNGNTAVSATLNLVTPIAGIDSPATVNAGGLTGGAEEEDDDSLRNRVLKRIQTPPNGGSAYDYEQWCLEVSGVTRAWVTANASGAGTVGIYIVDDDSDPIIPSGAKVTEVQTYIDDVSRKPVTADVTVAAPTAVALDLTISVTPNTQAVKDAVEAEIKDMLSREAEPGATILFSHLNEAISLADGETDHNMTVPAGDVTHLAAEIATFGVITWL